MLTWSLLYIVWKCRCMLAVYCMWMLIFIWTLGACMFCFRTGLSIPFKQLLMNINWAVSKHLTFIISTISINFFYDFGQRYSDVLKFYTKYLCSLWHLTIKWRALFSLYTFCMFYCCHYAFISLFHLLITEWNYLTHNM